jgi:RNA polymerase sigma factor (sigma-70 family)
VSADSELVRLCLRGQPEAMRELVARFEADVYALCFGMLRQHQDAEDVAQEVFLRVFRSLKSWDSARPLKPWVLTIAVNRCRTAMLKRSKLPKLTEFLADAPARPADSPAGELTEALSTAITALRSDYREVFLLYHEQALPYEEIAEIVDRPVGTIKTWLHRARLQVLAELQRLGLAPKDSVAPKDLSSQGAVEGDSP